MRDKGRQALSTDEARRGKAEFLVASAPLITALSPSSPSQKPFRDELRSNRLANYRIASFTIGAALVLTMPLMGAAEESANSEAAPTSKANGTDEAGAKFFETKIRPLLAERCFKCHGADKQKGDLRLDSLEEMLVGGESGPAIMPGKPDESHLVEAINYGSWEMPPDGKLAEDQIAALTQWVAMGAPWPGPRPTRTVDSKKRKSISDEDRAHWAYQPVKKPAVPEVSRQQVAGSGQQPEPGVRNPIDNFITARLLLEGLSSAAPADRATLIRRASFDLVGLPPTPEEVDQFVNDPSSSAFEQLVDRLLESPHYGERWGQHWLDLVRYAESDGFRQDEFRQHAWRYRDYVIRSLNDDKPYDQFIREQLAGDEIDPQNSDALTATGLLRHGIYEYNQVDVRRQASDILNEVTDVTADVFLAMGMGCARCHDHKFDPILQRDYYRLQAFFAPLVWRDDLPVATPEEQAQYEAKLAEWQRATSDIRRQIDEIEATLGPLRPSDRINRFPDDIKAILRSQPTERTPFDEQLYQLAVRQVVPFVRDQPKAEVKERYAQLRKQLIEFQGLKPHLLPVALGVRDVGPVAPPTMIPGGRKPQPLDPGFPEVLGGITPKIEPPTTAPQSTGRRAALADWIASPQNPLTARVMVNRIWQYHFGRGLSASTSDFGHLGEPPSHPELLDWLAAEFMEHGWSIKHVHRLIMASATYQQAASQPTTSLASTKDPQNLLLWRQHCRRLNAEQVRDATLAASGELDLQIFGPSVPTTKPRRTIYTALLRNTRDPLLDVFDTPDGYLSAPQRNITTTPTQALLMINGNWMLSRAASLAGRLERMELSSDEAMIEQAYHFVFGRRPNEREQSAGREFFRTQREHTEGQTTSGPSTLVRVMPQRGGTAAVVDPELPPTVLHTKDGAPLPTSDFTIEAFVLLQSVFEDSTVRTIAAQWDGSASPGWALGVTGERSTYKPANLILQVTGDSKAAGQHAIVASDIFLKLNCPYYVAAVTRLSNPTDTSVTFYVKDLADNDAPLVSKRVDCALPGTHEAPWALTIGGRNAAQAHPWDGLIDDVRLSSAPLTQEQLMWPNANAGDTCVGFWKFEDTPGFDQDSSGKGRHLVGNETVTTAPVDSPRRAMLIDFCHVLLNSSEFIYVD